MLSIMALLSSFGEDEAGEAYAVDIQNGSIFKFVAARR